MAEALRWYLALTVAGGAGLLPAAVLFERLRSRGVLYARPLALLLLAYLAWLASNLGVAPYGSGLVAAALALLWIASLAIGWRRRDLLAAIWGQRTLLLVGEALFVALFALFLLVRAQAPDAAHTEKPADLMVLTAVHNAERMPPLDTWYAGERLSYYHLGHTAVDVSARLAAVDLGFTFTLGVATAGALAGAAVFALAGDVLALTPSRRRAGSLRAVTVAGGVAVLSLLVLGTLEGGIELLAANGIGGEGVWGWIGVDGLPPPSGSTGGVPDGFWWWWRATRVVPGTIMEFPAFSLILGDLHPHLLALPLSVLALAVAATAFEGATPLTWRRWLAQPLPLLLSGLLFAGLAMTNSWDAAIYGAIWAAAAVAAGWGIGGAMLGAVRFMLPPVAVALIAAAPFLATIEGGARGIEFVTDSPVDPVRLAVVWLPLAVPLVVAVLLLRPRLTRHAALRTLPVVAAVPLAWGVFALLGGDRATFGFRDAGWVTLALLGAIATAAGAAAAGAHRDNDRGRAAWLGLVALAAGIVLVAELVQVAIAFGPRWNMVFKLWYGVWLLLAVAGGVAIGEAAERLPLHLPRTMGRPRIRPVAVVLVLAACGLVYGGALLYAPVATVSRAREGQAAGLDALAYLERGNAARAAAIEWVNGRLGPSDVLLEAVGSIYSDGNYVSAASGVPTLLGWPAHQCQWRGAVDTCRDAGQTAQITERRAAVARIYTAGATEGALELARQQGVTHVYFGREERRQFGADVAARFICDECVELCQEIINAAWPLQFQSGEVTIVRVPR